MRVVVDHDTGDEHVDVQPGNVQVGGTLWNTPAGGSFVALSLPEPADLDRLVCAVIEASRAIVEERTRPYRTEPLTMP